MLSPKIIKSCLQKEIYELINSKTSLFLMIFALIAAEIIPFFDLSKFPEVENLSLLYVICDLMLCTFIISQFLYDGLKKDFSSGGAIFLLNCGKSKHTLIIGKKIIALFLAVLIILIRIKDFLIIFSSLDFLWIALFFIFLIDNTFLFSMLFYTPNTNLLAYTFSFVVPLLLLMFFLCFRLPVFKAIIFILLIIFINKKITNVFYSKHFRTNLK